MKTPLIFLCFIVSLTCYGQKTFTLANHLVTKLEGKQIKTDMLLDPIELEFYDSLIFIKNSQAGYHFDIIDLSSGHLTGSFSKKGRGPGEIIFPNNFQILPEKNEVFAYDLNLRKVNFYNLEAILENNENNFIRSFKVDSAYAKRVLQIDKGTYLCPLIGDKTGHKYFRLDCDGKFKNMGPLLPDVGKEYNKILSANLFAFWTGINARRNKIVFAYDHWDKIEIITDVAKGTELVILGPKHKIPEFKSTPGSLVLTRNNIYAYCRPSVGENSFIVPYLGMPVYDPKTRKKTQRNYKTALHFDFNGKLLEVFDLEPGIQYMTVDWDKKIIYGINKELEPTLYEYRF